MSWHVLAGLIIIIGSVCTLLDWILSDKERKMDPARLTLIGWYVQLADFKVWEAITAASGVFNKLFDSVYGERPFSLRRIGMSILTSLIAIGISCYIYLVWEHQEPDFQEWGVLFLPWFLLINLIIDFMSLNKTRFILQKTENAGAPKLAGLLALDLASTVALYSIALPLLFPPISHSYTNIGEALGFIWGSMTGDNLYVAPVFFVAAFFTSLLFYLFLISTIVFKVTDLSKTRLMILLDRLEASDNLFKSIGAILSALLAAGKGVAEIVVAFSPKK